MPNIQDHNDVPIEGAIKIHPDLCYSMTEVQPGYDTDLKRILIWHWCTHSVWKKKAREVNYEGWSKEHVETEVWRAAGVSGHTLISLDPLHLEPSLYWPDCCGMHGFLRNGSWESV